jgi:threonine/homoserine/homoserine lactone efflux protein
MVEVNLAAFLAVGILVIVTPGQDTALTIRNTLLGHRGAGVATAAGVASGQLCWTVATSAGLAALLTASQPIFTGLRLLGAGYLIFLGLQSLRAAFGRRDRHGAPVAVNRGQRLRRLVAYRQGVLSNLGNPKMVVFFSSLLPQFVSPGPMTFLRLLLLGLTFCSMTFVWLSGYAVVVAGLGDVLRRDRIRRALEGVTGLVLVGLGLRLATERR